MPTANPEVERPPMIPSSPPGSGRWLWLLSGGVVTGLLVLYCFNPIEHTFYPTCQFYQLTHLHCPGCGSLRAVHQLTHGHFRAAFSSNPLLITALPLLAWLVIRRLRAPQNPPAKPTPIQPVVIWIMFSVVLAFGVLRNLPWPVFAWMAP